MKRRGSDVALKPANGSRDSFPAILRPNTSLDAKYPEEILSLYDKGYPLFTVLILYFTP